MKNAMIEEFKKKEKFAKYGENNFAWVEVTYKEEYFDEFIEYIEKLKNFEYWELFTDVFDEYLIFKDDFVNIFLKIN